MNYTRRGDFAFAFRIVRPEATVPRGDFEMLVKSGSLRVAERLSPPEENGVVHGVLRRAVRDLDAIRGRHELSPATRVG